MDEDLLYKIALTLLPQVGPVHAKNLLEHLSPKEIFHAKTSTLEKIDRIGPARAKLIKQFKQFEEAEQEILFIEKNKIKPLFIQDEDYPKRLLNCYDSPTLLYQKGSTILNHPRIVAVVGSRMYTEYGRQLTEKLIQEMAGSNVLVVSGLAYGIDALAHKACLHNKLKTVAVLAHGLNTIYPPEHASLAKDIIREEGGLLTELTSKVAPDKHHFPARNRIVAGMCDATIVVQTGDKGGSMITAELANGYNKDVFAFPGRVNDEKSSGCNQLIKDNKATLLTDARQLLQTMGWLDEHKKPVRKIQREIFIELSAEQRKILDLLNERNSATIDEINLLSGLTNSEVAAAILTLELENLIVSLPGKIYQPT